MRARVRRHSCAGHLIVGGRDGPEPSPVDAAPFRTPSLRPWMPESRSGMTETAKNKRKFVIAGLDPQVSGLNFLSPYKALAWMRIFEFPSLGTRDRRHA